MASTTGIEGGFVTTREACDYLGYSRPDSLVRAWRKANLKVYRTRTGRNVLSRADIERFAEPEPMDAHSGHTRRIR